MTLIVMLYHPSLLQVTKHLTDKIKHLFKGGLGREAKNKQETQIDRGGKDITEAQRCRSLNNTFLFLNFQVTNISVNKYNA